VWLYLQQDGTQTLKSRIAALGLSMIPGQDYMDSFSPVATYASVRLVIGLSLYIINRRKALRHTINTRKWERKTNFAKESIPIPRWRIMDQDDWTIEMYDVEAAFLNADIGRHQFIYVPEAMIKTGMMEEEESKVLAF
jgi:hypothetical protein